MDLGQIVKISKILNNKDRLQMIAAANQANKTKKYFRAGDIMNGEVFGEPFDKDKNTKILQPHFFKVIKAGFFQKYENMKGCYTFNKDLLKEYSLQTNKLNE